MPSAATIGLRALLFLSLGALMPVIHGSAAHADEAGWAALAEPGTHVLMRHATAPGTGDPAGFRLGDCATQRNLDAAGRAEARAIGAEIARRGIGIDVVLASQWCRARETAELLAVAPVEEEPALNSFFEDRANAEAAGAAVRDRLGAIGKNRRAVLVSHQVNITALTEIFPASGEMIVIALGPDGAVEVRGRIRPE